MNLGFEIVTQLFLVTSDKRFWGVYNDNVNFMIRKKALICKTSNLKMKIRKLLFTSKVYVFIRNINIYIYI